MGIRRFLVPAVGLIVGLMPLGVAAQTGPGPAAEKNAITQTDEVVAKKFFDGEAAATIWNMKPGKDESTATLYKRTEKMLREMVAKSEKLDYDTSYWRFLAYLRQVPWDMMSDHRRDWYLKKMPNPRLTEDQRKRWVAQLEKMPIYKMSPKELDVYLGYVHETEPDLRKRVVKIARQNLGQPYDIYLLGEFPNEVYDPDPTYCLGKGDCVVFSEHTYSMALGKDWKEFYGWLQKIRYKDGVPGMVTRNHFTEADWDINNRWLVEDVTDKLDATTVTDYTEKIDRSRFFKNFGIGQDIPVETLHDKYIPADAIAGVADKLQEGDFVNIVRGFDSGVWVGHVGMIAKGKDGKTHLIHSTEPKSVEVPLVEYVEKNQKLNVDRKKRGSAEFKGMKFLRLRADDLEKMISNGSGSPAGASGN